MAMADDVPGCEAAMVAAERCVDALAALELSPSSPAEAGALVLRLEVVARKLAGVQLGVIAEIDRRRVHAADGHRSVKGLVEAAGNLAPADAARRAKAARALTGLPWVRAGLAAGRIGVSQVDRIARAHANPRVRAALEDIDADLAVAAAHLRFGELDGHLREWERLTDEDGAETRAERQHRRRSFRIHQNLDGSWRFDGGCGSLQGTITADVFDHYVRAELEADWAEARARCGDATTTADLVRTDPQRRMDALERMALDAADAVRTATGHQITTHLVIDQPTFERHLRRAAGDHPGPDPRVQTYWRDLTRTDGTGPAVEEVGVRCSTLDGRHVDPAEAAAVTLVGHVRRVVLGTDSVVLDMGRRARLFTGPRHLAVHLSATTCAWPGCHTPVHHCQADHMVRWADGGTTTPTNGTPTCGHHNRFRDHGFTIHRSRDGTLHIRRPDGSTLQ